jgi:SAM-dependent methyltransferase
VAESYYDGAAVDYDRTRGGAPRAAAAAAAICRLLPSSARLVLDVAGGTGIVGARVNNGDRRVITVDRSMGMATIAHSRLPGQVLLGDATRLPVAARSVDAVTIIWLLHLLDETESASVIEASARVLRPGGALITTVDKSESHYTDNDIIDIIGPAWRATRRPPTDGLARITNLAATHGLTPAGRTTFTGFGQGRSPSQWRKHLADPMPGWPTRCPPDWLARLVSQLAALPDQHRPRTEPTYHLAAFTASDRNDLLAERHQ